MKKFLSRLFIVVLLGFFIYSATTIILSKRDLKLADEEKAQAAQYTEPVAQVPEDTGEDTPEVTLTCAPISVDFDALKNLNSDIVAWVYCEDTQLNYPILHTNNNSYYLKHTYTDRYSDAGAIFVDSRNRPGFIDGNTIVYGHHMPDGSMMTAVENWEDQEYYDNHKCMYLLTPTQDYRIDIISAYVIPANSNTYTVVYNTGRDVQNYLEKILDRSVFTTDVETDPNERYIVFSTCSHKYDDARAVLHGKLVPLDSAAGKLPQPESEETA